MNRYRAQAIGRGGPVGRPAIQASSPAGAGLAIVRDPLRILLFLLMVITISRVHSYVGLSALRPALVLVLLTGIYAFLNPRALNDGALLRTWPPKVMAALGVMACISVPFGMSIGGSGAFILETYSKVLLFAFLLIVAIRHVRDLYTFVWAYVISCGILVFVAVVVVGVSKTQGLITYDPNDLGLVLLVGLPLALAVFQSTDNKLAKLFSGATVAGIGMAMAFSMSRGGFVGLLAVGLALLFLLKGVSIAKRLGFVALAASALFVSAPAGYWELMETISRPTEDYNWSSNYGRRQVWERGIGYMMGSPLTGIGIGNFTRAEGTISEPAANWVPGPGRIKWSVAHNSFLEAGAEMGLPGLVLFSSLVFGGIVAMVRLRRRLPSSWARGDPQERLLFHMTLYMPVSLLAFAVTGFFVSFAYKDPIYVLAAFMAGLYAAVGMKMRDNMRLGRPASATHPIGRKARNANRRPASGVGIVRPVRPASSARRDRTSPSR